MNETSSEVIVIGAGLGGMSAAIASAARGASVTLVEKNDRVGGKCNTLTTQGYTFDLGPSILLLPDMFHRLFEEAGKRFDDYVSLVRLERQWRNVFADGTTLDLYDDANRTARVLDTLVLGAGTGLTQFLSYARHNYETVAHGFFDKGYDTPSQMIRGEPWLGALRMDLVHTMHAGVTRHFSDKRLHDMFEYFVKYVGSSAYRSPGFMNLLAWAQVGYGLWYIRGGIYNLARAFEQCLHELGVTIRLDTEVESIVVDGDDVRGVVLSDGERLEADAVVSNMEVVPAYERLLDMDPHFMRSLERYEPACSGLVLHLGLDRTYPQLAHHTFFHSADQKRQFHEIFQEYRLPSDPTVYVVAPTRTDPDMAPAGCDSLKILPHIPYRRPDRPYTRADYEAFADRVLDKLEHMGLHELRTHVVVRDLWTPDDIEHRYYSNCGSIYGVVTDMWKNYGFKAPKRSAVFRNLFFTGGSVNPGGGMPMVALSGLHAGRMAAAEVAQRTI